MTCERLRVAMLNDLRIGPYETPFRTTSRGTEWLIAERGGPEDAYLTISDTATSVSSNTSAAPEGLIAQNSIVAVLVEHADDVRQFLIVRALPDGVQVPGRFFPADGAARLSGADGALRLDAFGRHAHSRGHVGAQAVLHDIPHPAPNANGAITWHFSAEERPWMAAQQARTYYGI